MRLPHSIFICLLGFAAVFSHPDEVTTALPGQNFPINYKHYSGYLEATSGRHLHYWLVESQRSPSTDPLVLWLNGGPGCSSLGGFLTELGPFHVSPDGKTIYDNPYAWNKVANVLFLEAPSGVGFSYADNKKYATDDDSTSYDNYVALQNFFVKFPQFKHNEFYITGESYGGVYIPTLSLRVLNGPAKINFKGFAIGNGLLHYKNLTNSVIFFAYHHGLFGSELLDDLKNRCCNGVVSIENCNFAENLLLDCLEAVGRVAHVIKGSHLNAYNIYSDCLPVENGTSRYLVDKRNLLSNLLPESIEGHEFGDELPCLDSSNVKKYLNQPAVRNALHIPSVAPDWDICNSEVEILYKKIYTDMRPHLQQIISSGKLRGLIYNGDVDMVCNFLGDQWFVDGLGFQVLNNYAPWKFNEQVAGFVKYFRNLTFLTVKGSGHMVPQDKPGPALHMISSFLSNAPY